MKIKIEEYYDGYTIFVTGVEGNVSMYSWDHNDRSFVQHFNHLFKDLGYTDVEIEEVY